ncbi:MAG: DUF2844 domain-containing protein [Oryzomonas sp.]|uniref:DUF2844 domain-containing protein n=1 Tax=Oryzomonas sp. TaxID=2855186 RepID=UPI00283FDFAC|nr:DUF2844 domain-containing protein [Oryzomonas sp.]MDR3579359.1 DUF2844 domain-containing protein [Oryzomonas sp.]
MKNKRCIIYGLVFVTALFTFANGAHAGLGGNADTIGADRRSLSASHRATTSHGGYTVEEMAYASTFVREYISSAGIVFGVAWNGYVHPDLELLLGPYAREYTKSLRNAPRTHGRRRQHIVTDNVVVEKWGHMRDLHGRAYVPGLVPSGVSVDEIR